MRISEAVRDASVCGLFSRDTARELLTAAPADMASFRCLTAGGPGQGLGAWVSAALERWPASTGLDISAWALTDLDALRAWAERFGPGRVRVVMDSFVLERHDGKAYRAVVEVLGPGQVRLGCTHAKVARLVGADVVIAASGNIERTPNRRVENIAVDVDPVWAAEVGRWFDVAFEHVDASLEARALWDRSMRGAFRLASTARSGAVRGEVLPAPSNQPPSADSLERAAAALPEGGGDPSMRSTLESLHTAINRRLAGVVADGELVSLSRAALALDATLDGYRVAEMGLLGALCDVLEAAIEPRARAERERVAAAGIAAAVAAVQPPGAG